MLRRFAITSSILLGCIGVKYRLHTLRRRQVERCTEAAKLRTLEGIDKFLLDEREIVAICLENDFEGIIEKYNTLETLQVIVENASNPDLIIECMRLKPHSIDDLFDILFYTRRYDIRERLEKVYNVKIVLERMIKKEYEKKEILEFLESNRDDIVLDTELCLTREALQMNRLELLTIPTKYMSVKNYQDTISNYKKKGIVTLTVLEFLSKVNVSRRRFDYEGNDEDILNRFKE